MPSWAAQTLRACRTSGSTSTVLLRLAMGVWYHTHMTNTTTPHPIILPTIDSAIEELTAAMEAAERAWRSDPRPNMACYHHGKANAYSNALEVLSQLRWVANR